MPLTVKPTNRSGGVGVRHFIEPDEFTLLDAIDYRPILAQRHIRGESVSITPLCDRGRVVAHVAQQRDAARFCVLVNEDLLDNAARLATLTGYHGVANFDAVLSAEDGLAYLVEYNPRFWYSIYLVMIAGLNFVELALAPSAAIAAPATLDRGEMQLSLRRTVVKPWRGNRLDRRHAVYCLSDPVVFGLQRAKLYDDSIVAVPAEPMAAPATVRRPATV
ncbi:MAG TPA: ATP-grasp domain-containing protein [Stellaceae bacterium]|nr:ATP-grasp domain-containing protein [Stellaceae bacterium]